MTGNQATQNKKTNIRGQNYPPKKQLAAVNQLPLGKSLTTTSMHPAYHRLFWWKKNNKKIPRHFPRTDGKIDKATLRSCDWILPKHHHFLRLHPRSPMLVASAPENPSVKQDAHPQRWWHWQVSISTALIPIGLWMIRKNQGNFAEGKKLLRQ